MEVKKWKNHNAARICSNIKKILDSGDMSLLSKEAYNFVNLMSGFIAHYDLYGFIDYYEDVEYFARDLANSMDIARPDYYTTDRFFSGGEQAEYYASKTATLLGIKQLLEKR